MNTKKAVLVVMKMDESHREQMEAAVPQADFLFYDNEDIPNASVMKRINIIVGNPRRRLLPLAKSLEWLQLESAGANLYVVPGLLPLNVTLTNATGCYGLAISEYMIAGTLSLFLHLPGYRLQQQKHVWKNIGEVKSISGSTALVVGLGNIGGEYSKRFRALGGKVIGVRRSNLNKPDFVDELYLMSDLDDLLPRADVVALSLPETPETHKLFGPDKLARMKQGSILLNVGRGMAIDSDALCDMLNSGHLAGAVLDVTDPEPLPAGHPLWDAENVLITPHVSGNYNLPATYELVFNLCVDNLRRYFSGEPLRNIVDRGTGYKRYDPSV